MGSDPAAAFAEPTAVLNFPPGTKPQEPGDSLEILEFRLGYDAVLERDARHGEEVIAVDGVEIGAIEAEVRGGLDQRLFLVCGEVPVQKR